MLGKNALLTSTALVASLALAGCFGDSNTGGGAGELDVVDPGPLGLLMETPVDVMSADRRDNTVVVGDDEATITLNSLDMETGEFSITLGLPVGDPVTLTQDDIVPDSPEIDHINGEHVLRLELNTGHTEDDPEGDAVNVLIGLGLDTDPKWNDPESLVAGDADDALFMLTWVDPAADNGPDDLGFNTYMVNGVETAAMPAEGSANYSGDTFTTIYDNGELDDYGTGHVDVTANFGLEPTVDITLTDGGFHDYSLTGTGLLMDGSGYGGTIEGYVDAGFLQPEVDVTGDLLGAFFGADAEATAGVFGAVGEGEGHEIEIIGGFAAYEDEEEL